MILKWFISEKNEKCEYHNRLVCFDLNKRGKYGETLLHLCFSNGTYLHMLIAKRLINIYPNMINDIFIGDDYYGIKVHLIFSYLRECNNFLLLLKYN